MSMSIPTPSMAAKVDPAAAAPIVVLDSGLGGLTVVKALRAALPTEDIVYFGDTARLPYGAKSPATVTGFVTQIVSYLRDVVLPHPRSIKHVVIACNTATALALPAVRSVFPGLAISGVLEPGAKAAVVAAGAKTHPVIGLIATEATVRSRAYSHAVHRRRQHARLLQQPTPLLVPLIEEGRGPDDPLVRLALKQYLQPLVNHKIDVLVLGCTHYPIYKDLISRMVGPRVQVIDSANRCAEDVARRLKAAGALGDGKQAAAAMDSDPEQTGSLRCFVTDDPDRFARLAPRFLGFAIERPTWVAPEDLYAALPEPAPVRRAV